MNYFTKPIELKTKRLLLRTYQPGDAPQIHEYAGDSSLTMMYWLPNKTYEETEAFVNQRISEMEQESFKNLEFVIIYENRIVGGINLHFEEQEEVAYIGWVLNKNYRELGLCTEAAIAVRDFALNECGVTKLVADCDGRNAASANVMRKIGMQLINDNGSRTYPKTGDVAVEHVYELNKLKEPAFKVVDYFDMSFEQQQEIIHQIDCRNNLWAALPVIENCLKKEGKPQVSPTDGGFHDLLGPGHLFLMLDENNATEITVNNKTGVCPRLAAFVSLAHHDEVDIRVEGRENWTPWVSFVFTYPEYRGQRLSEKLVYLAEEFAVKDFNAEYTYISTDHIGLYEKYGYEFYAECGTVWGESTRVLRKKLR